MRTNAGRVYLAVIILSSSTFAFAQQETDAITGIVTRVVDGDAIHVLQDKTSINVRLEGIDAPESGQAFGTKARQTLASKILAKTVNVQTTGTDKYGRTLGIVWLDGRNVNLEMVTEGWAWHFKKYSKDAALATAETEARGKHVGLWTDAHPQSPWDWRATEKQRRKEMGIARATADPSVPALPKTDTPKPHTTLKPATLAESHSEDTTSVVYIIRDGRRYHSPGCVYLKNSSVAISLIDAKQRGLTPCSKCGGHPTHVEDHSSDSAIEKTPSELIPSGSTDQL